MNDDQDKEQNSILAWVLGIGVLIAIAAAFFGGFIGLSSGTDKPASAPVVTAAAPVVAAAAPVVAAAAPATKPDTVKVYFDSGKFTAPAGTDTALKALAAYATSSPNAKLAISGFHDKTGDPAANAELAKNRAKAVLELLKASGIPEDRVMLQKPQEVLGAADDREARRVEVFVAQ
jgi:cytochrome c oxidase subunit II